MPHHSPEEQRTTSINRPLRWTLVVLALLAVVGAVALVLLLSPGGPSTAGPDDPVESSTEPSSPATGTSQPPSDDPSGTPTDDSTAGTPTPTPTNGGAAGTPSPSDPPTDPSQPAGGPSPGVHDELEEDDAATVVDTAITTPLTESNTADALAADLADVAVDDYARELEAQWLELTSQGWTVTGTPKVDSIEVTDIENSADPVTAKVLACIDSSDVTTVDADGDPIGNSAATMPRALHQFTMVQDADGIWRISDHSFPDDPSC